MSEIDIIVLFNGTSNDDTDPYVTNIVKLRDGLKKNKNQIVIYENGIGNDQQWHWRLTRWFAEITGWGGHWIMHRAYKTLISKIREGLERGTIKKNDTIKLSVGGFSRGAALARHFTAHHLQRLLKRDLERFHIKNKIQIAAEYLFDTVASFGIPTNIWLLTLFGINNQEIDIGWDFNIPNDIKAYHALSLDERRNAFTPKNIDIGFNKEEIWFDGDHSTVGGGHKPTQKGIIQADENPLRYMIRKMQSNGLEFDRKFLQKYKLEKMQHPLGEVHTPIWDELPPTQRGSRKVFVQRNQKQTKMTPTIFETVFRRMKENKAYRPEPLAKLRKVYMRKEDGSKIEIDMQKLFKNPTLLTQYENQYGQKDMAKVHHKPSHKKLKKRIVV